MDYWKRVLCVTERKFGQRNEKAERKGVWGGECLGDRARNRIGFQVWVQFVQGVGEDINEKLT